MPGSPNRVFLHIGLHKTGTTYLQNLMRANRDGLRAQQVDFPGGSGEPTQTLAVYDLQGRRQRGVDDKRVGGAWNTLVEAVGAEALPTTVISEERLSLCTPRQARRAVESFPGADVQVIVTVRDLGRAVVSSWQQLVKAGGRWTWREFADAVKDPSLAAQSPALGFWLQQEVDRICQVWESAVSSERVHVVTVPPAGSSPEELLRRFSSVVGFAPGALTNQPARTNEAVGAAGIEVIRSVNERLGGLNQRQQDRLVNDVFAPLFAQQSGGARFALPEEEVGWVAERGGQMVEGLRAAGYPVVGDLDELRVRPEEGRPPDDVTPEELLDASLDALAAVAEKYAGAWWQRRRSAVEADPSRGDVRSLTRGALYRGQRAVGRFADRNPLVAKAVGTVLRRRHRAPRRSTHQQG